jgi:hypothetical protein
MPGEGGSPGAEWDDLSCKAQGPYNARHNERSTHVDQSPGRLGRVRLSRANRLHEVAPGARTVCFTENITAGGAWRPHPVSRKLPGARPFLVW